MPKAIDSGMPGSLGQALFADLALLGIFAIQHSGMARPAFKRWWTRFIPKPIERSTYVLLSSLLLLLLFWQWRPVTDVVWDVEAATGRYLLWACFWTGWVLVLTSTFLINHFDLFGLRQVYIYRKGDAYSPIGFRTPLLYKIVRHPIMLGFVIAFWTTPRMTLGHFIFAVATMAYILIALQFEERDLVSFFGEAYEDYRKRVSMLLPWPKKK